MPFRHAFIAFAAFAAASAFGQGVATATSVNGVATVVSGGSATTLAPGMPLVEGARIVTTSSATATLRTNSGCTLVVPPAHAVTLVSAMSCQQLQAALQPVGPAQATSAMGQGPGSGANPPVGLGVNAPVAVWAAALGLAIAYDAVHKEDETPLSGH